MTKPARSTVHQDTRRLCGPLPLCHCLPRSPRTRNLREARAIRTQNPRVGLYRFATAFPGHREHVALQQQSFASAWPVAILHLEGFKTCAKHGPSRHKTRLWAFTALPLPSQVTANTLPCSSSPLLAPGQSPYSTPFRGFQNVREARPITTQNPSVGLYRFAAAFPSHREHVALQRQPFASAWLVAILRSES